MIEVDNKDAHAHTQFSKQVANSFLFCNRTIHVAVVFYRAKARLVRKTNLV